MGLASKASEGLRWNFIKRFKKKGTASFLVLESIQCGQSCLLPLDVVSWDCCGIVVIKFAGNGVDWYYHCDYIAVLGGVHDTQLIDRIACSLNHEVNYSGARPQYHRIGSKSHLATITDITFVSRSKYI